MMNSIATDGEGRYSLNSFIHYLKPRHHQHSNGSGPGPPLQGGPHPSSSHHGYYDQEPSYRFGNVGGGAMRLDWGWTYEVRLGVDL